MNIRSGKCRHVAVGMALFVVLTGSPGTAAAKQVEKTTSFRVNSGFLPQRDGFSFANWTSNPQRGTGVQLLIQLFGRASICTNVSSNDPCIPLQTAEHFAAQVEDQLAAGRCEGLTVLAAKMHAEGGTPASLIAAEAVSTNIDYWWATQMLPSVAAKSRSSRSLKPSQLVNEIRQGVVRGATSTLGMYFQNDGHSVLPISIQKNGEKVVVGVYDSNTPLTTQQVLINTSKNTWSYTSIDATGNIVMQWTGIGAGTLDVVPQSARQPESTSYFSQ